jgi:hypothetical protein
VYETVTLFRSASPLPATFISGCPEAFIDFTGIFHLEGTGSPNGGQGYFAQTFIEPGNTTRCALLNPLAGLS